jgi:hypothetical protein
VCSCWRSEWPIRMRVVLREDFRRSVHMPDEFL